MKKILLWILALVMLVIIGVTLGARIKERHTVSNVIDNLVDAVRNAPQNTIGLRKMGDYEDCVYNAVTKKGEDWLYIMGCEVVESKNNPHYARYVISILGPDADTIECNYDQVKGLLNAIESVVNSKTMMIDNSISDEVFKIISELDQNIVIQYDDENIPDVVQKEAKSLIDMGYDINYVGQYDGKIGGYTGVDVYQFVPPKDSKGGFPILYAVHDDKIIKKISGHESLSLLKGLSERTIKKTNGLSTSVDLPEPFKDMIPDLVKTIKNAPDGTITVTDIPYYDDCRHIKIDKDGKPFLYERACFSIGARLQGFDPVKFANYRYTIYNDDGTETEIEGNYEMFKELIKVISDTEKE